MGKKIQAIKLIWKFRRWIKPKILWALWKARKPIKNIIKEIKKLMSTKNESEKQEPGKFTTEFFLVLLTNIIAIIGALKGMIGAEWTGVILAILNGTYGILRTLRKNSSDRKEVELKKIKG